MVEVAQRLRLVPLGKFKPASLLLESVGVVSLLVENVFMRLLVFDVFEVAGSLWLRGIGQLCRGASVLLELSEAR